MYYLCRKMCKYGKNTDTCTQMILPSALHTDAFTSLYLSTMIIYSHFQLILIAVCRYIHLRTHQRCTHTKPIPYTEFALIHR